MLEVKIAGVRHSAHWDGGLAGSGATGPTLYRGMWVYENGVAATNLGPALNGGNLRTPRFAAAGDRVVTIATSGTAATKKCYPVNKLLFQREDSYLDNSSALDKIASGEYLIYFEGGEYETDRYGTIASSAKFGDPLYLDANGYLTTATGAALAVRATFIDHKSTYDSNYHVTGMLWFRVLTDQEAV